MTTTEYSLLGDSIANRFSLYINIATYESIIAEFISMGDDVHETGYTGALNPVAYARGTFRERLDLRKMYQEMQRLGRLLRGPSMPSQIDPGLKWRAEIKADQYCIRLRSLSKQLVTTQRNFVR